MTVSVAFRAICMHEKPRGSKFAKLGTDTLPLPLRLPLSASFLLPILYQ